MNKAHFVGLVRVAGRKAPSRFSCGNCKAERCRSEHAATASQGREIFLATARKIFLTNSHPRNTYSKSTRAGAFAFRLARMLTACYSIGSTTGVSDPDLERRTEMQKFFLALIALAILPSIADAHERRGRGWYEPYRPHYSARPYDFMYPYGTYQPRRHLHVPPPSGYTTTIYCESWQGNLMVDQHGNYVCVR